MYTDSDRKAESPLQAEPVILAFAKLDRIALGVALGAVFGGIVFLATIFLVVKGGPNPGRNLSLLNQYFAGYSVTTTGAFVGLLYAFLTGFVVGWFVAFLRNLFLSAYLTFVRFDSDLASASEVFEDPAEGVHKT
jgi:hypothetical protein